MRLPAFIALAALAAATGLGASTSGLAAAPKPTPTPTPVALQYDELARTVMPGTTAPPPGSFQDDYKLAMSSAVSGAASTPTPAPPKHHGLGGLIGNAIGNAMGGSEQSGAPQMTNPESMMNAMRSGHVTRYTFYYTKNWVREDDPIAQTATISKCPQHQFISLNLAKKTYRLSDTSPKGCAAMPPAPMGPRRTVVENEAPGTADLTMTSSSKGLGPLTIDGIATTGASSQNAMSMTNATGSCQNSDMKVETLVYTSRIRKPRAYCPLATPKYVPSSPTDVVARGGCKPKIHASGGMNGMRSSSDLLEMYRLMTMSSGGRGSFGSLLERGNVAWLYRPQADPLFEIPAGFTEEK